MAVAQSPDPKPQFEAAAVRTAAPSARSVMRGGPGTSDPAELNWVITLRGLLMRAYSVDPDQISAPDWSDSATYELRAKLPQGTRRDQFEQMLQNLMAERFNLVVHLQTKTFPAYNLSVGKKGSKLKLSEYAPPPVPDLNPDRQSLSAYPVWMTRSDGRWTVHGRAATADDLVKAARFAVHGRVIDQTGLNGRYDFTFDFDSSGGPAAGADAIREQLGLSLDAIKISLPVVIVDHVDRTPTSN